MHTRVPPSPPNHDPPNPRMRKITMHEAQVTITHDQQNRPCPAHAIMQRYVRLDSHRLRHAHLILGDRAGRERAYPHTHSGHAGVAKLDVRRKEREERDRGERAGEGGGLFALQASACSARCTSWPARRCAFRLSACTAREVGLTCTSVSFFAGCAGAAAACAPPAGASTGFGESPAAACAPPAVFVSLSITMHQASSPTIWKYK